MPVCEKKAAFLVRGSALRHRKSCYMCSHSQMSTNACSFSTSVCVCVCSCALPPIGRGSSALPYLGSWCGGGRGHMGGQQNPSDRNKNSEARHSVLPMRVKYTGEVGLNNRKQTTENSRKKEKKSDSCWTEKGKDSAEQRGRRRAAGDKSVTNRRH